MNSKDGEVTIPFDSVLWNIKPVASESETDGILVKLKWGWGWTEDDYESVTTSLDMIEELRDNLNLIIEKHKKRHEQLMLESEKRINEKFPITHQEMIDYINKVKQLRQQ